MTVIGQRNGTPLDGPSSVRPLPEPYPLRVWIRSEDLSLLILDRTEKPLGTLPLAGMTLTEGYEWLSLGIAIYMGTAPPVIERPELEMPPHALEQGGNSRRASVANLVRWRDSTTMPQRSLKRFLEGGRAPLPSVAGPTTSISRRCWKSPTMPMAVRPKRLASDSRPRHRHTQPSTGTSLRGRIPTSLDFLLFRRPAYGTPRGGLARSLPARSSRPSNPPPARRSYGPSSTDRSPRPRKCCCPRRRPSRP